MTCDQKRTLLVGALAFAALGFAYAAVFASGALAHAGWAVASVVCAAFALAEHTSPKSLLDA